MRFFAFITLIMILSGSPALAQHVPDTKSESAPAPTQKAPSSAEQLDALYQRLRTTTDADEGAGILRQINRLNNLSPSPTASLLMQRAGRLMADNDVPLASEMMDRVVQLAPQWPQAWFRRAIVFNLSGDTERTAIALLKALSLDPRHMEALEMLGALYANGDDDKNALIAFRKALALYPASPDLQETVRKLSLAADERAL